MQDGHDEYAEACVRLGASGNALLALDPLVKSGKTGYFRMALLGLAWAERGDADRARWYLDLALRLGEMERPRRTDPAPQGRILDEQAQLLYAECAIKIDTRIRLDRYFIPIRED